MSRADHLADRSGLEGEGRFLEGRHHATAREEPQVAALVLGARVLAHLEGHVHEVGPFPDALHDRVHPLSGSRLRLRVGVLGQPDQDVPGSDLLRAIVFIGPLVVGHPHPLGVAGQEGLELGVSETSRSSGGLLPSKRTKAIRTSCRRWRSASRASASETATLSASRRPIFWIRSSSRSAS